MSKGTRFALWVAAAAAALAALAWWQRGPLTVALVDRQVRMLTANADPLAALPDGLHVGLCGAGSPFPDEQRGGPCTVVVAGHRMFVVDAGGGSARTLARMRLNAGQIEAIFLTHYHSDHIDGLGELLLQRWIQGAAKAPVPVHGPVGLTTVLEGFQTAYTPDRGYRVGHHGEDVAPPSGFGGQPRMFDVQGAGARQVLLSEPDLEVVVFAVDHSPAKPAVGYRFRYKDRTVVISGDTRKSADVAREARGADLLVHEALSPQLLALLESGFAAAGRKRLAKIMHDVLDYHTTPDEAAQVAQDAGVRALVFNHIVPPLPSRGLEPVFVNQAPQIFRGPLRVGMDGDWYSMPVGSTAVNMGSRP